ncbi:hypothetical protein KFU94_64975 [Chloroflexi bacterium TSY]|nr:hypothetical protein [Chloroflexi bacterium TSY]
MNLFYYLPAMVRIQMVLVAIGCAILSTSCRDRPDEIVAEPVELNISTGYGNLWGQAEKAVFERFEENHPFIQIKSRNQDLTWQDTLSQSPYPIYCSAKLDMISYEYPNRTNFQT